tara:strand:- start:545 stop:832 length:288 start_codon:yes stop_codon:yes gene_type:complete
MWHKCGKFCANIRDISEHLFFLVIAKVFGGTVAQGVFLDYKRWYKRIIAVPRQIFTVAQVAQYTKLVSRARDFFGFCKNKYTPKYLLYVKTRYET